MGYSAAPPTPLLHRHNYHYRYRSKFSAHTKNPNPNPNPNPKINLNRRSIIFLSTSLSIPSCLSLAIDEDAATPPSPLPSPAKLPSLDTIVTDRVFMDFSLCSNYFRSDRTLGDEFSACEDSVPLGRVVFGLYGRLVPLTVSIFKAMCTGSSGSSYKGTLVQKNFPGQFFVAGRQGLRDRGEVRPVLNMARNTETADSRSFLLGHSRPGVLSLCLSENDDDEQIKLDPNYRNVEFLVTTGPGPCPQLDNRNMVFGTVLEGLDVVEAIASIPTYEPSERIREFNYLAEFLGDERAQNARISWNSPLKTVYISDCGELKVAKPSLPPSLP